MYVKEGQEEIDNNATSMYYVYSSTSRSALITREIQI